MYRCVCVCVRIVLYWNIKWKYIEGISKNNSAIFIWIISQFVCVLFLAPLFFTFDPIVFIFPCYLGNILLFFWRKLGLKVLLLIQLVLVLVVLLLWRLLLLLVRNILLNNHFWNIFIVVIFLWTKLNQNLRHTHILTHYSDDVSIYVYLFIGQFISCYIVLIVYNNNNNNRCPLIFLQSISDNLFNNARKKKNWNCHWSNGKKYFRNLFFIFSHSKHT